jgi:hypothetical protein
MLVAEEQLVQALEELSDESSRKDQQKPFNIGEK